MPIYNEAESIEPLVNEIADAVAPTNLHYEIICVDDGSKDGSTNVLTELAQRRTDLKAVILRRNYGQTPAMAAGFESATGKVIVTLDGDLQNDPADIPMLLAKLEEGYDLVSGWRLKRQGRGINPTITVQDCQHTNCQGNRSKAARLRLFSQGISRRTYCRHESIWRTPSLLTSFSIYRGCENY